MKKLFVPIFVLTLVVVLPAISWYYLQSGVSWRKEAMGELADNGSVKDLELIPLDRFPYRFNERMGSSFVVHRLSCSGNDEIERIGKIVDQFSKRPDVEFIIVGECTDKLDPVRFSSPSILISSCEQNEALCKKINEGIFAKAQNNEAVAFVDGKGIIRRFYNSNEISEWKRLVEHVSMMLPDERKQYGRENKKK